MTPVPLRNFSENSSVLVPSPVPNSDGMILILTVPKNIFTFRLAPYEDGLLVKKGKLKIFSQKATLL